MLAPVTTHTADRSTALATAPSLLEVVEGEDRGAQLVIERGAYVIGQSRTCDLALEDGQVSRRHAEIRVEAQGLLLRDLGSKNGTFVHGTRITEAWLQAGSIIRIGGTRLQIAGIEAPPRSQATSFGPLLGGSVAMRRLYDMLERIAQTDVAVLIEGETGTGKDVCARAIHRASARAEQPFVVCDLASMSGSLIESELFGHVKGAFTGAIADKQGLFAAADRGTIFIDEIGELEVTAQPRLLRALEQHEVRPVGGTSYHKVDARTIAATNRDLSREITAQRFRADLYHRLAVVTLRLPPLRERREDIPQLVESFLGGRALPRASAELLMSYDWPGNVRELRNVVERAVALVGETGELDPSAFLMSTPPPPRAAWPALGADGDFFATKDRLIAEWERRYLVELLERSGGNVSDASRNSGIGRSYLHRLMRKHKLRGHDDG
jgi:two-component system, NtrC family, nitrogen regulation response regulator GlnG